MISFVPGESRNILQFSKAHLKPEALPTHPLHLKNPLYLGARHLFAWISTSAVSDCRCTVRDFG